MTKVAIGQDSHRFIPEDAPNAAETARATPKPLRLGGVEFLFERPLDGDSDADVVLHAICNAISGITCVNILGDTASRMCFVDGIIDSAEYVREAMKSLREDRIVHISLAIECAVPKISPMIPLMRNSIARIVGINENCIGITATSGENMTPFGKGLGISVFCAVTTDSAVTV